MHQDIYNQHQPLASNQLPFLHLLPVTEHPTSGDRHHRYDLQLHPCNLRLIITPGKLPTQFPHHSKSKPGVHVATLLLPLQYGVPLKGPPSPITRPSTSAHTSPHLGCRRQPFHDLPSLRPPRPRRRRDPSDFNLTPSLSYSPLHFLVTRLPRVR